MRTTTRLATFEDVPVLQELIAASARGLSDGFYTPAQAESAIKYVFGVDSQLLMDGTYYLVETKDEIIACGGWSMRNTLFGGDQHKEMEDPLLNPAIDAARIRAFFVSPNHARQGVGRMLIDTCETAAKNYGFSRIELGATLPGVPLYEAMGYRPLDRIELQFPNGETLGIVKMEKHLV